MSSLVGSVRSRFQRFADVEVGDYSPHYRKLARDVASNDKLLEFIAGMPDHQPNIFFASVQYLSGPEAMPKTGTELAAFVKEHSAFVDQLMRTRHTQTNEVGRCAIILPALPAGPLALIEVGASAGLCLLLDRFFYDYGGHQVGDSKSPVVLSCDVAGPAPLPDDLPEISWRHGLDIDPVDTNDEDGVRWLRSCIWPDHVARRARFDAAVALCRTQPPPIRRGDLVDDLPDLIASAPERATLVVFHSAVFPYVPAERRKAFADSLASHSKSRQIVWISNEGPRAIPEIDALALPQGRLRFQLGRTTFTNGQARREFLAFGQYHGWDLEWVHGI